MSTALLSAAGRTIAPAAIDAFRGAIQGQTIAPGDEDYESARRIWNWSIDKHPGLIVRCASAEDVIASVNFAREHNVLVAVRGGGHNVGGRALCDDGLVVDLSRMKRVQVDTEARRVRAQSGCTLGDLDAATHESGLAVPTGVITKTGIAGLTLGGGVGWLMRKYGLTCDNVLSYDLVTADGRRLTVTATDHPDLFWALRGGGGNFGIVLEFEYRAYPISHVLGGMLVFPRDRTVEVLQRYRDVMRDAPDELGAYAALMYTPEGEPATALFVCYSGDHAEGERIIAPLRDLDPVADEVGVIPFPEMQSILDDAAPEGIHNYWKSTFLRDLSDEAIRVLVEHAARTPSTLTAIMIEHYGGAVSRVPPTATAYYHRSGRYNVGILSGWPLDAAAEPNIAWTRGLFDALQPYASGAFLLNFLDREEDDAIRATFGANYDRLVEVKNAYDPTNFFRQNQNVQPTV